MIFTPPTRLPSIQHVASMLSQNCYIALVDLKEFLFIFQFKLDLNFKSKEFYCHVALDEDLKRVFGFAYEKEDGSKCFYRYKVMP